MATVPTAYLASAVVDAEMRLVTADPLVAELHRACGGVAGDTLAVPELRALAEKAQGYGLRLSRQVSATDGENRITAWVEVTPITRTGSEDAKPDDSLPGCTIDIVNWHSEPLPPESEEQAGRRKTEIMRDFAECIARLDPGQRLLSLATEAHDLTELRKSAEDMIGRIWTDIVRVDGAGFAQPMHWRLLDGATCRIEGSERAWTASLEPLGKVQPGSGGFVLYLIADRPLGESDDTPGSLVEGSSFGRDLTPVLRQPINRIIANAETIRTKLAGPIADDYSSYAADIATAAQHLLALIDDLSDLEVVESEEFVTAPDRIDLADVARRACGILGVRARERGITLIPPAEGETQLAIAEFRRVLQILLNLVGNAIRYAPENSQVWVRLDRIGTRATITVADQGHGLDESQQHRIFEKFERLGRSGDGGSGLGLYISRRIARAMDGELTVESAPGQGARFTLSVPAAEDLREKPR